MVKLKTSLQKLRSGSEKPVKEIGERQIYQIDGINFVTSKAALEGKQIDIKKGASGL